MTGITYAIYPPAGAGLPWLAVVRSGMKPLDMFGCESREAAEHLLRAMRARRSSFDNGAGHDSISRAGRGPHPAPPRRT